MDGATSADFMGALAVLLDLIQRAITEAGSSAEQAQLAVGHFEMAARDERERRTPSAIQDAER